MKRSFFAGLFGAFVICIMYPGVGVAWDNFGNLNPHLLNRAAEEEPEAVVVKGTNVYITPDYDEDIIFYHAHWYRIHNGRWDMSMDYNGPWTYVPVERVPEALLNLPANYRRVEPGQQRVSCSQLKMNWKAWEEEGRWDAHAAKETHRYYREAVYTSGGARRHEN